MRVDVFCKDCNKKLYFSPIEDKETLLRLALNYLPFWDITTGRRYVPNVIRKQKIMEQTYE